MLVEYRDAVGAGPLDGTAEDLHLRNGLCESVLQTKTALEKMMHRGTMYKLLEKELGVKVCFVLGVSLSETYWTKLLTKSTPRFKNVVAHMRTTTLVKFGQELGSVEGAVIRTGYDHLIQGRTDWAVSHAPW